MNFTDFALDPSLVDGINAIGYKEATPIQQRAIPVILEGKDLIGCAQTGTGKTAAYLLPTIHRLMQAPSPYTRVLVISPTRELALQIDQQVEALGYFTNISSVPVYGGNDKDGWDRQKAAMVGGVDMIIATPGRLLMHQRLGYLDLSHVETVILDEADKMLDMGFSDDIFKILSFIPEKHQTLLFSATMPKKIRDFAMRILNEPEEIVFKLAKPAEGISQFVYAVFDDQKIGLLEHIIKTTEVESMILFSSSKSMVDKITSKLVSLGIDANAIHSDKDQSEREETLLAFRNRQFKVLVGTDVLARGIDIDGLSHVVNFDCPPDAEDYVHRIGRTARADAKGMAITFVNPKDMYRLAEIEELIEREIPRGVVPEEMGKTPEYGKGERASGGDRFKKGGGGGGGRGGNGGGGGRDGGRSGGGDRQNRGDRGPRQDRGPRPERQPRPEGQPVAEGETPPVVELEVRQPRPERGPRPERQPRAEGEPRPEGEQRPPRAEGDFQRKRGGKGRNRRPDQPQAEGQPQIEGQQQQPRPERQPRDPNQPRPERQPRAEGDQRPPRPERQPRPEGEQRPPRDPNQPRQERQPRGDGQQRNNGPRDGQRREGQQPRDGQPRDGQRRDGQPRREGGPRDGQRNGGPRDGQPRDGQRRDGQQPRQEQQPNGRYGTPKAESKPSEEKRPWWKKIFGLK